MIGDPGPYVEIDGPRVWVPRTVPYRQARLIALEAVQEPDQTIAYRGKADGTLYGFVRDCFCEDYCLARYGEMDDNGDRSCEVPVWSFEIMEKR